jgi:hypothetical protein
VTLYLAATPRVAILAAFGPAELAAGTGADVARAATRLSAAAQG